VSVEAEILPPQTTDQTRTALPWDKSCWKITSKPMPALWCCEISSLRRASLKTYLASRADNRSKVASELVRTFVRKISNLGEGKQLSLPIST
jgi:hypothetical protein